MWVSEIIISDRNLMKYKVRQNQKYLSVQDAIQLLSANDDFVRFFNGLLCSSPYEAYFWEVKPISLRTNQDPFEFVLTNSPTLSKVNADNTVFSKYFNGHRYVTSFLNLAGDSRLIVPVEISETNHYSHLAAFVRNAPEAQIIPFWNQVGEEVSKALDHTPKWLSTSGLGVSWLHVRIDPKPKYYHYKSYKVV